MTRGKFWVVEGPDHCGKTTLITKIHTRMAIEQPDRKVIYTREPGGLGIKLGEQIRALLLSKDSVINPIAEAYLYGASRAQHISQVKQWLDEGNDVICDRYYYSSVVYQGYARGLGMDEITALNRMALQGLHPDKIFYLKVDMDTYRARKKNYGQEMDRIESEDESFFQKVIKGYEELFGRSFFPAMLNVHEIDARRSEDEVFSDVWSYLTQEC